MEDAVRDRRSGRGSPRTQRGGSGPSPQTSRDHRQRRPERIRVLGIRSSASSLPIPGRTTPRTQRHPRTGDECPHASQGRLSYERASTLFKQTSGGWTLHHSSLTHLGEKGASTILLQAKSRHQNPRTLAIYTKRGNEAIAHLTSAFDKKRSDRCAAP